MRLALLFCLVSVVFTGCAAIEDYHYCLVHDYRAAKAYQHAYGWRDRWGQTSHYACGWKKGYYDVSTGSNGQPPAIPPTKYWAPSYQDPKGQHAIHDWYAGYQDGATAAQSHGTDHWHWIPTGPTIPSTDELHSMVDVGPEMMGPVDTLHSPHTGAPIPTEGTHQINTWPQPDLPEPTANEPTPAHQARLAPPVHLLPTQANNSPVDVTPISVDPNSLVGVPQIAVPETNTPSTSVPATNEPRIAALPARVPASNIPPASIAPTSVPSATRTSSDIMSQLIFPPVVTDVE